MLLTRLPVAAFARVACPARAAGRLTLSLSLSLSLFLGLTSPGAAQAPAPAPTPAKPQREAARIPAPLPPAKLEEALRLLLRADSSAQRRPATGPEAAGLVLDQTLTKPGHDFFELFYNLFEAPAGGDDYTITLVERPGRIGQGLLVLTVNELELLELPLLTQPDQLAEAVAEAVGAAQAQLLDNQRVSRQLEAGRRAPPETF